MKREQSGSKRSLPRAGAGAPRKSSTPRKSSSARSAGSTGNKFRTSKSSDGTGYAKRSSGSDEFKPRTGAKRAFGKSSFSDKPYARKSASSDSLSEDSKPRTSRPSNRTGSSDKPYARKPVGSDRFSEDSKPRTSRPSSRPGSSDKPYARKSVGSDRYKKEGTGRTFDKRSEGDAPRTPRKKMGISRGDKSVFPERTKRAYGSADTFKDRKNMDSFYDKKENDEATPRTRTRRTNDFDTSGPGKGKFTKKSELKGFKPRVSEGKEEDFRFKRPGSRGKAIDLGEKKEFVSKSKSQSKERITEDTLSVGGEVRLNRFISNAGVCSRREADELIGAGLVSINGTVVIELGSKVKAGDVVRFNGEKLTVEAKVYILLNKPKDAITTADDPDGRNTVMDIFDGKMRERIYPIGRLDRNTTGVLLLTNDGELANRLMHPKYEINKVYKATLNKSLKPADLWTLSNGVELEDGFIKPDAIAQSDAKNKNVVGIEIHSGKNRIIHRMFEHLGYTVDKLDRVLYAGVEKGTLKRGEWRELNDKELKALKRSVHMK
ncbi:MAG: pseudouridine synthase [Bacteroidota bacterium]|nr:pseudouridine synthase [Bacteroidota bacterium]